MYVNYVDCGTAVARANEINTNAFDASDIFRDVYISCYANYVYCGTEISVAGYLKFSRNEVQGRPLFTNLEILEVLNESFTSLLYDTRQMATPVHKSSRARRAQSSRW